MGCTLGYGALHKIPAPLEEPPHDPGETLFDNGLDEKQAVPYASAQAPSSAEFLIPAELQFEQSTQAVTSPPAKRERKQKHVHISPSTEIDEYFREGEEKSRKEDKAPTLKSSVPPPPKVGGPPKAAAS